MGRSIESLPPSERAKHYRELAAEAMRAANNATDQNMKDGFLAIAASWHKLAQEAEGEAVESHKAKRDQQDGDDGHSGGP